MHNRGKRCAVVRVTLPLFANTPSPGSQALHAATNYNLLLPKLYNLLVNNYVVYITFTTCSGYSEDRDRVIRGTRAPRPSYCPNRCEDFFENFIAVPANVKTLTTAPSPRKASAASPPKSITSSQANKRAPTVHQARSSSSSTSSPSYKKTTISSYQNIV